MQICKSRTIPWGLYKGWPSRTLFQTSNLLNFWTCSSAQSYGKISFGGLSLVHRWKTGKTTAITFFYFKPSNTIVLWWSKGFHMTLNWAPIMSRDASLSDSYTVRCCFCCLVYRRLISVEAQSVKSLQFRYFMARKSHCGGWVIEVPCVATQGTCVLFCSVYCVLNCSLWSINSF